VVVAVGVALAVTATAVAGIVIEEKPVALVTRNLVMHNGKPFVPLADLARALGGTSRWDPARVKYEIQPGPNGVLLFNRGALGALGPGGGPEHKAHDMAASQNAVKLSIGGQDVSIDEQERVMLRPPDPAISLDFLARMLGGKAKIDPGTGMWVLPRGGPGDPMMFTK